jgi:hypothetical protein
MRIAHFRLPIADCNSRAGNHRKSTRPRRGSLRSAQWAALLFLLAFLPQTVAGPSAEATSAAVASLNRSVVDAVDVVGMTVGDMDRSIDFFFERAGFRKGIGFEVAGEDYERLQGVFECGCG